MRLNKYLASTLFTGLFVTASVALPAAGQAQALKPQSGWSVSKVDKTAQGGNSYCTLSRKYTDGVVLSLGRSQTEEYSLAIDFQKKVFEKDASLKINLQPGPGQSRAYNLMPASERAVVVRLGWDEGFFNTLNKSQQMQVKIADKDYSFSMPEIAKGQSDLADCMEELKSASRDTKGEKAGTTTDVLAAGPKSSKVFDAAKMDAADAVRATDVAATKPAPAMEGASAKTAMKEDVGLKEEEPKRRNFAKAAEDKPVAAKSDFVSEDMPRKGESEKLAAKAQAPSASPVLAAKPQMDAAADQGMKQASSAQADGLQAQLSALRNEKQMLQQKLDAAKKDAAGAEKAEEFAAMESRLQEMEARNKQLEDSLRQAQVRIGETAINTETRSIKRIAELETKLQAAQNDNNALAKQLESMRVQKEDMGVTAIAGDWDLEQATKRFNEAEREIRRLGLQLEQERTSCNREKAEIEQMLFDPAVANQKQIERLSQLELDLKAAQDKVADTQKMVRDQVAAQVAQKTQALEQQSQSLNAEKAGMNAQIASLQKSLADREASITALQKKVDGNIYAEADKQRLEQQVAELQKSLAEREANVLALQKTAEANKLASAEKVRLEQQMAELQKTLAAKDVIVVQKDQELAALKAQPKADPAQIAAMQAQIKSMADAMTQKDKAVIDAQNAAKTAQAAIAQKDQELAALKAQPKADPAQIAAMQAQIKSMAEAMTQKDKAVVDAQNAAKATQTAAAQQPKTDPAVLKQIAELQAAMGSVKADNEALRGQNASLRQESDKLRAQLTSVSAANAAQSGQEVSALTRQLQQLQKQVADMQQEKTRGEEMAMAETYAAISPAAGMPAATMQARPAAAAATPVAMVPNGAAMSGYDQRAIQSLLQKSGVGAQGVSRAASGFAGADNFAWSDPSNVKGMASVRMVGGSGFDDLVNQYIAFQKGQCAGDFASMPSPTNGSAAKKMALYEIACVGSGGANQSASLLFFEDQGRFIAISNQIDAANMDVAMDSRDKIAGFVRGL